VVGIAGAVSVGKSTTAGVLQGLLAGPPDRLDVAVVSTDGFLYKNAELQARGLTARKGSPESYDVARLVRFLTDLKSGRPEVFVPVYSHLTYDIVAGAEHALHAPDVVILEGVNVLDTSVGLPPFVVDLLDYSVYLDADESDIERWYVHRFLLLCAEGKDDAGSFYHHFSGMSDGQISSLASGVWRDVNGPMLRASVLPSRDRADLIMEKGPDHAVRWFRVRTS
jgi:type I pantothenate kinase